MNLRDLEYIQAVAKFAHFGKAAAHCNVSQPALSGQIKKLEQELGIILFERDNRSVRVTNIGQEIISLADQALSVIAQMRLVADAASDPFAGAFRIGAIPTIAPYLVECLFGQVQIEFPKLSVYFEERVTTQLEQAILTGGLDAGILATEPDSTRLAYIKLFDDPFWVVMPKSHDLARKKKIYTADLPLDELLLLTEGHCFRDQAMDVCKLLTPLSDKEMQVTNLTTLLNLVAGGQGITLAPDMAVSKQAQFHENVVIRKLEDAGASRRLYLTYRKNYPRVILLEKIAKLIVKNAQAQQHC